MFSYTFRYRLLKEETILYLSIPFRPPRVRAITFISYICQIYCMGFGQCWTLFCYANSSAPSQPLIWFLFIRPRFCLRLPSDSTSPWTPLPLASGSHYQAHSGLSPPSYRPCRAHIKISGKLINIFFPTHFLPAFLRAYLFPYFEID
jgi:hypothetical protein